MKTSRRYNVMAILAVAIFSISCFSQKKGLVIDGQKDSSSDDGGGTKIVSCINEVCEGSNEILYPVVNAAGMTLPYPVLCKGNYRMDARGARWEGFCKEEDLVAHDNCNILEGDLLERCLNPQPVAKNQVSCVNSYCEGYNSEVSPVANDNGESSYDLIAFCPGKWTADTRGTAFTSGCKDSAGNSVEWKVYPPATGIELLKRYFSVEKRDHRITTLPINDNTYNFEGDLGFILKNPSPNRQAIYECRVGETDYFLSLDSECEGETKISLGPLGHLFKEDYDLGTLMRTKLIYRCHTGEDGNFFVSDDPNCEGLTTSLVLGKTYIPN